ncbi:MAG: hypothetical protein D6736_03310 [Nitrospinota bacterium]|nr:MAG: hypothetical protein D6736_03310 [Nitrospinota bacterium]
MTPDLVQQFKAQYEALAGRVHIASHRAEAGTIIATLLQEVNAERVAVAELPTDLQQALIQHCTQAGITLLRPPFDRASLPQAIDAAQVGISTAAFGIAMTGTLVEVTTDDAFRLVSTLPRIHIALVRAADLVPSLEEAAPRLRTLFQEHSRHCTVTFISGPSRTGDIEMRLTLGVHGPEMAHAIVLQEAGEEG